LDLRVSEPAEVYAMAGRARAFAAAERLSVSGAADLVEGEAAEPPERGEKSSSPSAASGKPRRGSEEDQSLAAAPPAETRRMVFRGRRSQLLRLLGELSKQDAQARVALISPDNSVHRGWDQVLSAAERIGAETPRQESKALADFVGPSLTLAAPQRDSGVGKQKDLRAKGNTRGAPGTKAGTRGEPTSGKLEHFSDAKNASRSPSEPIRALGATAGWSARPDAGTRSAPTQDLDRYAPASQPASAHQAQLEFKAAQVERRSEKRSAGWVNSLLELARQAESIVNADPLVEVTLQVYVVPPVEKKDLPQFEFAPQLRLDAPKKD
jgi:hypothetical protein